MTGYLINSAVGAIAGWAAGYFGKGSSYGTIANLIAGAVGGNGAALAMPALTGAATAAATSGAVEAAGFDPMTAIASLAGGGGLTMLSSLIKK